MAHQPLQGGQGHSGSHHIRAKCVPTPVGISVVDLAAHPMVPEQRSKPDRTHRLAALPAFQANEKGARVGEWTFQEQVAPENLQDFRGQRDKTLLVPFAIDAHLAVGELWVFELQSQDLTGAQAVEEQQADEREIAVGAEALPELGDFFGRERHDDSPILFEAEAYSDDAAGQAVAERRSLGIAALEMLFAGGNLLTGMKAIAAVHRGQTMIHGLWGWLPILLQLVADIVDDRRLGDGGKRPMLRFEPAGEVEQVVGVDAQRTRRELAEALSIEESIGPVEFSSLVMEHTIGGGAGGHGRLIDHAEFHLRPQPQRSSNCLTLSRSAAASRRAVLRTGGREEPEGEAWSGNGEEASRVFLGEQAGRSST